MIPRKGAQEIYRLSFKKPVPRFRSDMDLIVPMQVAVEFQGRIEGSRKTRGQLCLWGSKLSSVSPQNLKTRGPLCFWGSKLSSVSLKQYSWSTSIPNRFLKRPYYLPCQCSRNIGPSSGTAFVKNNTLNLAWFSMACKNMQGSSVIVQVALAVGVFIFTIWGLGRVVHPSRNICQNKSDSGWKKGGIYHVTTSYILPLFLCAGVMFKCRTFDPVVLPTEAGQIVKQLLNFVGSISAGLAVNYIISCVELLAEKVRDPNDANRITNPVIQFMDRFLYCFLRISATMIFIEALGFPVMNWNMDHVIVSVLYALVLLEIFKRMRAKSTLTLKGGAADIRIPSTAAKNASLDSLDEVSTQVKFPSKEDYKYPTVF